MPKTEYIDIDKLPSSHRGLKEIPKEWIAEIQRLPIGKALIIQELKYSTVQGRIHNLIKSKTLEETYKVIQRKQNGKPVVYIAHFPKEE